MSIQDYGSHPTKLAQLTDDQLYACFRASGWEHLDNDRRLELMQEAVNRSALSHGEIGSCQVLWDNTLSPSTMASQTDDFIWVNSNAFHHGRDIDLQTGKHMEDASLRALEAVLHEDEHAYQNQIINDVIPAPSEDIEKQYKANDVIAIPIQDASGQKTLGSCYIRADNVMNAANPAGYYDYYFQSTERDAFRTSQEKVRLIVQQQSHLIGQEMQGSHFLSRINRNGARDLQGCADYLDHQMLTGYQAQRQAAEQLYAYPEFEQDLNTALTNIYYHEHAPMVDPSMQDHVADLMKQSYSIGMRVDNAHGIMAAKPAMEQDAAHDVQTNAVSAPNDMNDEIDMSM